MIEQNNQVDIVKMEQDIIQWVRDLEHTQMSDFTRLIQVLVVEFDSVFEKYDLVEFLSNMDERKSFGEL